MNISIWGWGSYAISTWGWGSSFKDYIPIMAIAEYVANSQAYICVPGRACTEILSRDTGEVLLRLKPDILPTREVGSSLPELCDLPKRDVRGTR